MSFSEAREAKRQSPSTATYVSQLEFKCETFGFIMHKLEHEMRAAVAVSGHG